MAMDVSRAPISEILRDASQTPPEVAKFDSLVFPATIGVNTLVQPGLVRVPSDYDFSCYGIRGFWQDPGTNPENQALVTFNAREQGRNYDIFTTDQNMAMLVGTSGPANDMIFPERTMFRAGSELQFRFTRAAGWTQGEIDILLGVVLFGEMIAKGIGRR